MVATRVIAMRKLIALKPDAFGGIPSNTGDPSATDKVHHVFANWYQVFRRRNKFSIRLETSVGQKKPSGWGRVGMGDGSEDSRCAHRNREEAHHGQERWGGGVAHLRRLS